VWYRSSHSQLDLRHHGSGFQRCRGLGQQLGAENWLGDWLARLHLRLHRNRVGVPHPCGRCNVQGCRPERDHHPV